MQNHSITRLLRTAAFAGLIALTSSAAAQATDPALMQQRQTFETTLKQSVKLGYLLHLPKGYQKDSEKKWPLMLFLHGAGERGDDLARVAVHGPPKLVKQGRDFPFILVSPQCATGETWDEAALLALLDDVMTRHQVDPKRVYLTGLSMGGYGSWMLGMRHPERFAAIAPICGGGNILDVLLGARERGKGDALQSLPIRVFHGGKDPVVPLSESERMVAALKKAGNKTVELTVYPEAQHDSWTATYDNAELFTWFLKQHRP